MSRKLAVVDLALAAVEALASWLNDLEVAYTTIGGLAVALVAQPRVTGDMDVTVWLGDWEMADFVASGQPYGFVPRIPDALEFARQHRVLLMQYQTPDDPEATTTLDVSLAAMPFEREMLDRATSAELESVRLMIPTPEDLVIMKAVARRSKDVVDMASILELHPQLDRERVRDWTRQFAEVLEMPELLTELEQLFQRIPITTNPPTTRRRKKK